MQLRLVVIALFLANATAFVAPTGPVRSTTIVSGKGLSIGDISGGGGKAATKEEKEADARAAARAERPLLPTSLTSIAPPKLPSISAPSFSAPKLPSFSAPEPPPPPPKAKASFKAPSFKAPSLSKKSGGLGGGKVSYGYSKPPAKPVIDKSKTLNDKGRILVNGKFQSRFDTLVDRKVMYNPLKAREGVAPIAVPKYIQEMEAEYVNGGKKGKGGVPTPALLALPFATSAAAAGAASQGIIAVPAEVLALLPF